MLTFMKRVHYNKTRPCFLSKLQLLWDVCDRNLTCPLNFALSASDHLPGERSGKTVGMRLNIALSGADDVGKPLEMPQLTMVHNDSA